MVLLTILNSHVIWITWTSGANEHNQIETIPPNLAALPVLFPAIVPLQPVKMTVTESVKSAVGIAETTGRISAH